MKKNSRLMIIIAILLAFCAGMQCGRSEERYLIEKTAVNETVSETGSETGNDITVDDDKEGHFSIFATIFLIIVVIIVVIGIFTIDKPVQE